MPHALMHCRDSCWGNGGYGPDLTKQGPRKFPLKQSRGLQRMSLRSECWSIRRM
jgi:hypothetical protein